MSDLSKMSDEQVVEEYDSARGSMSYYNAAEGNWSSEAEGRGLARDYLNLVGDEMEKRNLTANEGSFLC